MLSSFRSPMRSPRQAPLALVLLCVLAGCGTESSASHDVSTEDLQAAQALGIVLEAELDPESGAVVLPYSRFFPSPEEAEILQVALSARVSACAAEKGVAFEVAGLRFDPIYNSNVDHGPWTTRQAETFGFVSPMTERDLVANGMVRENAPESTAPPRAPVNQGLTDADWDVIDECGTTPEAQDALALLGSADGPWVEQLAASEEQLFEQEESKNAVEDLGACFVRQGLTPATEPEAVGFPQGADFNAISEEQILLALKTVGCKDETDFTNRIAQVHADLQAPTIVTYADELLAQRAKIDAALPEARALAAQFSEDE